MKSASLYKNQLVLIWLQERSEGTSSVAFEVLIINSQIDFINLFIINCLESDINLIIFNCLKWDKNLFIFSCLTSTFFFPKIISFGSRRERMFMGARPYFCILCSPGEMMTCYIRDTNKFLRYCSLCTSILRCGFPAKGIKLTRFILLEAFVGPQLWDTLVYTILVGTARKFAECKWSYGIRNFSVVDTLLRLHICS